MSPESSPVLDVTAASFEAEVLRSDRPTIVDFWAPWCGVCRTVRPLVDVFAEQEQERVKVVALDAQEFPDMANRFGVMALPTFLAFHQGEVIGQHVGSLSVHHLAALARLPA